MGAPCPLEYAACVRSAKGSQCGAFLRVCAATSSCRWGVVLALSSLLFFASFAQAESNSPLERLGAVVGDLQPRPFLFQAIKRPRDIHLERLLEFTEDSDTRNDAGLSLLLVFSLDAARDTPHRNEILLALRDMSLPTARPKANVRIAALRANTPEPGQSDRRPRMAAMLALVKSGEETSLAHVLSQAYLGEGIDPWGQSAARRALHSHPNLTQALSKLRPLLSDDEINELSRATKEKEVSTLEQLLDIAENDMEGYVQALGLLAHELGKRASSAGSSKSRHDPGVTSDALNVQTWKTALATSPLFALRSMTLLGSRLPERILRLGDAASRAHLADESDLGRSARWFRSARKSPDRPHPSPGIPRKNEHTTLGSEESPSSPTEEVSTKKLWAAYENEPTFSLITELCSRYRSPLEPSSLLTPPTEQMRLWLADDEEQLRAACSFGLSRTTPGPALDLLIERYLVEDSPQVRRALVYGLVRFSGTNDAFVSSIARLDDDPGCREIARGQLVGSNLGFFAARSERPLWVITRTGQILSLEPAADGFVGAVAPAL